MRVKLFIATILFALPSLINAQEEIYWSGSSVNGEWDWGAGCTTNAGGNWYWNSSGSGNRSRPDCYASFNKIFFDNNANLTMNLNSLSDFSVNQIQFKTGTSDRVINSSSSRSLYFQNNNGNCKIENYAAGTTQTINVPIVINPGNNYIEFNPVNGYLNFINTITNNSSNSINVYGNQQVTFSGNIIGTSGITINNTAVVVFSGVSKAYTGTTTINTGSKLKISSDQTLTNLDLKGGTLQIDAGTTLSITGSYTATGGTIDNKGTIKYCGGTVTFPGSATINNGVANTMTNFEVASTGIVTLNSLLRITNNITVSSGTLSLGGNDLRLNNATLSISTGAAFDNGGENQIINESNGFINISGTFITRDKDGFFGTNSAIPSITPSLYSGSTIEYGLNGDQVVQGATVPVYSNITFSGSGTKILASANDVSGTITVSGTAIFDASNFTFGGAGTNITMTGSSTYKLEGSGTKPTASGTYSLGNLTTFEFTGTSATNIRLSAPTITYANIIVSGTNVSNSGTATGIKFQNGGKFTVKNGAVFKLNTTAGFSGATNTAINSILNGGPTIILETGSTIEYSGANQIITPSTYSNLTVSGSGLKTTTSPSIAIGNDLNITASELKISDGQTFVVNNKVNNTAGIFTIENNGSLVQVNDAAINAGDITYNRISNSSRNTDYSYWSTPVSSSQTLSSLFPKTLSGMYYSYKVTLTSEDWEQENTNSIMEIGKGYIIRGPEPVFPFPPSYPTTSFFGVPNNGILKVTNIFPDKSYLIGNPYPSALNADKFLATNAGVIDGTLYFWTHKTDIQDRNNITSIDPITGLSTAGSGAYAYTSDDYASYNYTGGVGVGIGYTIGGIEQPTNKPTGNIAAAQGFFTTSNGSITGVNEIVFNNNMRVDNNNNTMLNSQFYKNRNLNTKVISNEKHRIWLNFYNAKGAFKQTLIGYIANATNEYDCHFDGLSFDGNEFVDFYSINQDKNLVIQGRALPFDENDEIPLGYKSTIEGEFSIKIDQADGLLAEQEVYIEDLLNQTVFDLTNEAYTFYTKSGAFNDRFILRYTNKTLNNKDFDSTEKQVLVSNKNKQIIVNSNRESIGKVAIYDILGKQLFLKEKVNAYQLTIDNLVSTRQTLLVKVSLQNGQTITKKIMY